MTEPRRTRYRFGPSLPTRPWERDRDPARYHRARHRVDPYTPNAERAPAVIERHAR